MKLIVLALTFAVVVGSASGARADTRQPGADAIVAALPAGLVAGDALRGIQVEDEATHELGTVDRLILDRTTGKVQHVIVGWGGVLGFGREHAQIAWSALSLAHDDGAIVARVDRERFGRAPRVEAPWFDRAWAPGQQRPPPPGSTVAPQVGAPVAEPEDHPRNLIAEDVVAGSAVRDAAGREIGSLTRVMIEPAVRLDPPILDEAPRAAAPRSR